MRENWYFNQINWNISNKKQQLTDVYRILFNYLPKNLRLRTQCGKMNSKL